MGQAVADDQQSSGTAEASSQPPQGRLEESSKERFRSLRGREAQFGSATDEVERILAIQKNYYAVLKVKKGTPAPEVRQNYFRLSRLVHPDKCSHPQAKDASAVVNQAYGTLSTAVKKALYDQYVDDAGDLDAPAGMSYADWEAQRGEVQIPRWMEKILRIPGGAFCLLLILLPFTLLLLLVCFVVFLLCLPVRLVLSLCCGVKLQPPGQAQTPSAANEDDFDEHDRDVVINMPEETVSAEEGTTGREGSRDAHRSGAGGKSAKARPGQYQPPPPV